MAQIIQKNLDITDKIIKNAEKIKDLHETNSLAVSDDPIIDNIYYIRFGCDNQGLIKHIGNPSMYENQITENTLKGRVAIRMDFKNKKYDFIGMVFGTPIKINDEIKTAIKGGFEFYSKKLGNK